MLGVETKVIAVGFTRSECVLNPDSTNLTEPFRKT